MFIKQTGTSHLNWITERWTWCWVCCSTWMDIHMDIWLKGVSWWAYTGVKCDIWPQNVQGMKKWPFSCWTKDKQISPSFGLQLSKLVFQNWQLCGSTFPWLNGILISTVVPCILILSNCLHHLMHKFFKRSTKIYIKTAPTCFGVITILRERTIWAC